MPLTRRSLLAVVSVAALPALPGLASAEDLRKAERAIGRPDAKITVDEFYSLTCSHCAAFARQTLPPLTAEYIDTGKVRWVFHDFPLDQVALTAAMVALYLPPDRYEPFVDALLARQDKWAFARGVNSTDEIWKIAALAGLSRETFDKAIADEDLKAWILEQQAVAEKEHQIDSTPSFLVNGKRYAGEMNFSAFSRLLADISG